MLSWLKLCLLLIISCGGTFNLWISIIPPTLFWYFKPRGFIFMFDYPTACLLSWLVNWNVILIFDFIMRFDDNSTQNIVSSLKIGFRLACGVEDIFGNTTWAIVLDLLSSETISGLHVRNLQGRSGNRYYWFVPIQ